MTRVDIGTRIYTVVDVMRGVAVGAYSFRRARDARVCIKRLRSGRSLEEDDVRLFESTIDALAEPRRPQG